MTVPPTLHIFYSSCLLQNIIEETGSSEINDVLIVSQHGIFQCSFLFIFLSLSLTISLSLSFSHLICVCVSLTFSLFLSLSLSLSLYYPCTRCSGLPSNISIKIRRKLEIRNTYFRLGQGIRRSAVIQLYSVQGVELLSCVVSLRSMVIILDDNSELVAHA